MADADSNESTPEQDAPQDDAVPTATLLSLPTELLPKIRWSLAPLGGKKTANLRLVSRQLASAIAPVVWAPLSFDNASNVDLIVSEAWKDQSKHHLSTKYIYCPISLSLPALFSPPSTNSSPLSGTFISSLHLPDAKTTSRPPRPRPKHHSPPHPPLLPLPRRVRLPRRLQLSNLGPDAARPRPLGLRGNRRLFCKEKEPTKHVYLKLKSLEIFGSAYEGVAAILAMTIVSKHLDSRLVVSITSVTLGEPGLDPTLANLSSSTASSRPGGVVHFILEGLPGLFYNHFDTVSLVVQVVTAKCMATIRELSLSVHSAFDVHDAFAELRAPNVEHLTLSTEFLPSSPPVPPKLSSPPQPSLPASNSSPGPPSPSSPSSTSEAGWTPLISAPSPLPPRLLPPRSGPPRAVQPFGLPSRDGVYGA